MTLEKVGTGLSEEDSLKAALEAHEMLISLLIGRVVVESPSFREGIKNLAGKMTAIVEAKASVDITDYSRAVSADALRVLQSALNQAADADDSRFYGSN